MKSITECSYHASYLRLRLLWSSSVSLFPPSPSSSWVVSGGVPRRFLFDSLDTGGTATAEEPLEFFPSKTLAAQEFPTTTDVAAAAADALPPPAKTDAVSVVLEAEGAVDGLPACRDDGSSSDSRFLLLVMPLD